MDKVGNLLSLANKAVYGTAAALAVWGGAIVMGGMINTEEGRNVNYVAPRAHERAESSPRPSQNNLENIAEAVPTPKTKPEPKVSYRTKDFSEDSEEVALARTLFGEGRLSSDEELYAIAYSVVNRSKDGKKWNGEGDLRSVVHAPSQYSCFNEGKWNEANLRGLKDPETFDKKNWKRALRIADSVMANEHPEFNKGQTHYFNEEIVNPSWAKDMEVVNLPQGSYDHTFRKGD